MGVRRANDRVAEKAERLQFVSGVPMLCECADPDCHTIVMIRLADYRAIRSAEGARLTAPGHLAAFGRGRGDDRHRAEAR